VPPTEPAPVQVAMANPSDLEPGDAGKAVSAIEIVDECLVVDTSANRKTQSLLQDMLGRSVTQGAIRSHFRPWHL
jgi:hypothetical protein